MVTQNNSKFKGFGSDPCSNTGSNSQNVSPLYNSETLRGMQGGLDWLQGTIQYSDNKTLLEIIAALERHLEQKILIQYDKPIAFHKHSAKFECKALIGWNEPEILSKEGNKVKPGRIYICLPATALKRLLDIGDFPNMYFLFQLLDSMYGFKATRFDAACDDFDKRLDFNDIECALRIGGKDGKGEYRLGNFAGFKTWEVVENSEGGISIYCGSRQSDEYLCIYDKDKETKGLTKSIRLERRLKDEKAHQAFNDLMNIQPDDYEYLGSAFFIGLAIGKTQFINRTYYAGEKNLERIPVLNWWKEFTEDINFTGYIRNKVIPTLVQKKTYVRNQVVRVLATIKRAEGAGNFNCWLNGLMAWADKNLSPQQENYANEWLKDRLMACTA